MSLNEYNKKRSFDKTPEPKAKTHKKIQSKANKQTKQLRFVIQKHDATRLHYDFRLELDGTLKSWTIPKEPSLDPSIKRLAMMVEDHPISYINFEGTIPKGNYGAGGVSIWDQGFYHSSETIDPVENEEKLKAGLKKGGIHFLLYGQKLKGLFSLIKVKNDQKNAWLLIKHDDEYATHESTTSIKSRTKMPHDIQPMLSTLSKQPFNNPKWIFEVKWDGYRAITEIEDGEIKIYSRNHISFKNKFPTIVEALKHINENVVLDGEIIAPNQQGGHSFQSLQNYENKKVPVQYMIFDILYKDGQDLRNTPLLERKRILKAFLNKKNNILKFSDYIHGNGIDFFNEIKKIGMEGIIAKESDSLYQEGVRGNSWLKIKNINTTEAIICGLTEPRGSRKNFGALILGTFRNGKLSYAGHTGGGFDDNMLTKLYKKLIRFKQTKSPFENKIKTNAPVKWLKPKIVCEVKFSEWTSEGHLRQPIFIRIREDKKPSEVFIEKPQEIDLESNFKKKNTTKEIKFTNLDKIYWPKEKYTKNDLIEYYKKVAPIILPYLKDRPENLNRHPNGIEEKNFYQKNVELPLPDFVESKELWSESNNKNIRYLICQNEETLLYLANLGCIEINPWLSRVQNIDKPDYMLIDLDPGSNSFDEVVEVALMVHQVLLMACEDHYCKTSGKSGMHIVVPLGAKYDYDTVRIFAEMLMRIVHKRLPKITSLERNPEKRKDKIYLDYLQNRRGQTIAAPYSVRPYPGATVSTPLAWSEVRKGLNPNKFTIKTVLKRIKDKGDLWKPTLEKTVDLEKSIKCLENASDYIK